MGAASPLDAQKFPGLGGFDLRIGGNSPAPAGQGGGFSAAIDADLGYFENPHFRTVLGFSHFRGSVQRTDMADGSFTATGARAGLRGDFPQMGQVRPYAIAALTGHVVGAEVVDPGLQSLVEGFYVGGTVGMGAMVTLDDPGRLGVAVEARRLFANNIGGWAFEIGIRWSRRGPDMYRRTPEDSEAPGQRAAADRAEVDRRTAERWDPREDDVRLGERDRALLQALRDLEWDLPTLQAARETERGLVVVLDTRVFRDDGLGHMLTERGRSDLARIGETIRRQGDREVRVEVTTDSRRWTEDRLAERRADSVRSVLISEGLDPDRITAVGQEADRPERVEILIRMWPGPR